MSIFTGFVLFLSLLSQTSDEAAVRKLLHERDVAWQKQDVAALIAPFAEDADHIDSSGNLTVGRKAIEEKYKSVLASGKYKGSQSTQGITRIRFIKKDVAVVDAEWKLSGLLDAGGKPLPDRAGTSVVVVAKEPGEWKIVTLRVALSAPKAPEPK